MNLRKTLGASAVLACLLVTTAAAQEAKWIKDPRRVDRLRLQPGPERSLPALRSRAEFDRLARVYTDQPYALPHVIFVIDRKDRDRVYYVNSRRYRFHKDFVNGTYLSLERGEEFFKNNYMSPNRRFILGTLAYQAPVKRYT